MAQHDIPNLLQTDPDGPDLAALLDNFFMAQKSGHSGASRPGYALEGLVWSKVDGDQKEVFFYDGDEDKKLAFDSDLKDLRAEFDANPGHDPIINGAMNVAQRGTSFDVSGGTAGFHTVDRFKSAFYGNSWAGTTHTREEQSTDAPPGFAHSFKCTALLSQDYSDALGSWIIYKPENRDMADFKSGNGLKAMKVGVWLKSNKVGNVTVSCEANFSWSTIVTINTANTWEFKIVTIPATALNMGIDVAGAPSGGAFSLLFGMGSNGSWLVDTDDQWNDASTNRGILSASQTNFHENIGDYLAITGVQLVPGETLPPFRHELFETTLKKCRWYYRVLGGTSLQTSIGAFAIWNTDRAYGGITFEEMRAAPSGYLLGVVGSCSLYSHPTAVALTQFTLQSASKSTAEITIGWNGSLTRGQAGWLRLGANVLLVLDAEI